VELYLHLSVRLHSVVLSEAQGQLYVLTLVCLHVNITSSVENPQIAL
jgi:hypothetical protein